MYMFKSNPASISSLQISESLQKDEFGLKYKLAEKFEHVEQLMIDSESNHTV